MKLKRRSLLAATLPASALVGQQLPTLAPAGGQGGFRGGGPVEMPVLNPSAPDAVGEAVLKFFSPAQIAALTKLASMIMPPMNGLPGAVEVEAPQFLDFLLSESPADRKQLYRIGVDSLNTRAHLRFKKSFADLSDIDADSILAPLRSAWSSKPTDSFEAFLRTAKADIRLATLNSRAHANTQAASGNRRFGGSGLYWHPLD